MVQLVQGTVDTQKNICRSLGRANAGDDLKLELEIQMNGKPITFVNPTCELLIKKTDNNKVRQTKDIIYQDGKFKIKVDQQGVTCPGTVINQLVINDEGRVSTCLFYFTVGASLEKEILQSISKVETLEQLDSYVVAAFSNLDEYEKRLTLLDSTMTTTNEEITANESERKSNESERKDNETLRIENEKERVKKENEMSAAEIDRKASELDRIKNENARRIAENTRIARENARENAEINRNAIFEENEAIRTEAEKLRVQAEIKRKESFSNLESLNEKLNASEENRVNSEEDRISKETERQLAEAERERAEANREKTYTSFNNAEVDRKNSEDARIQAEASRVQAENARSEQFEAAQSARETKFQEVENNRDKLFKANETARATEEIARKKAESTREGNETIRVNSESLRVAAEKARQQEEIKRGQAEVARVEAEKSRELSYEAIKKDNSTFKQQMNEDFGNAKTDYFGKEHLNVVDRLNNDFDNVHQRINDSNYLEYSGSNIKANNSYYGYTKGLSIKGRALQNLFGVDSPNIQNSANRLQCSNVKNKDMYSVGTYTLVNLSDKLIIFNEYEGRTYIRQLPCQPKSKKLITLDLGRSIQEVVARYSEGWTSSELNEFLSSTLILKGDYTNTPIEEIPFIEGVKSVGENEVTEEGKYPVNIKSCGKNLFDKSKITQYKTIDDNGVIKDALSGSFYVMPFIKLQSGKKYIFSVKNISNSPNQYNNSRVFVYGNGQFKRNFWLATTRNLILGKDEDSIAIKYAADGSTASTTIENIETTQLEEGTSVTTYEPYQETTQELQLTEPLRSLPNGVCDEITECGVLIRRCGESILDGSKLPNKHTIHANGDTYTRFRVPLQGLANSGTSSVIRSNCVGLCDKLPQLGATPKGVSSTSEGIYDGAAYYDSTPVCYISIANSKLTNGGIVEWLKTNPIKVIYELDNPVEIPLTNNINLKTYAGTTHITSDNYLQPKLSCKVPSNVQAVISNLKEENEALNTKVSTLNLENEEIKETNTIQDELIDTTMMATDEMYMMLEPLLAETLGERSVSKMVDMYVAMVQRGIKTIDQVPVRYREQVKKILDQLEK